MIAKIYNFLLKSRSRYGNISLVRLSICRKEYQIWLRGQAVKTSPFHGGNTGSIPVGVICTHRPVKFVSGVRPARVYGPLAQLVRATGS